MARLTRFGSVILFMIWIGLVMHALLTQSLLLVLVLLSPVLVVGAGLALVMFRKLVIWVWHG